LNDRKEGQTDMKEMILYYAPKPTPYVSKLKGVLVRMGIRIKNISPDQTGQRVGYLAGMPGFEAMDETASLQSPVIEEEMLVMKNCTSRRIDELLTNLRKANVPKIALKAIITEQNSQWPFYQLYEELKKEHAIMTASADGEGINAEDINTKEKGKA